MTRKHRLLLRCRRCRTCIRSAARSPRASGPRLPEPPGTRQRVHSAAGSATTASQHSAGRRCACDSRNCLVAPSIAASLLCSRAPRESRTAAANDRKFRPISIGAIGSANHVRRLAHVRTHGLAVELSRPLTALRLLFRTRLGRTEPNISAALAIFRVAHAHAVVVRRAVHQQFIRSPAAS